MPLGPFRYEKAVADTEKAVRAMRDDYLDLDSPSPHAYISHLRDQYEGSQAHMTAGFTIGHHKRVLMSPHFGQSMVAMGISVDIAPAELFWNAGPFQDGLIFGLAASHKSMPDDFDDRMVVHVADTLAVNCSYPQVFAQKVTELGLRTYEHGMDCPPVPDTLDEDLPPNRLKRLADELLADLYDDETKPKYFKVGAGIARHAYNSCVMLADNEFANVMSGVELNIEGFN